MARRRSVTRTLLLWAAIVTASPVAAAAPSHVPSVLIIDAESAMVLHAEGAGQPRHPASLTKMMTVYVALSDLAAGRATWNERIVVSARAAGQGGARLGLVRGDSLSFEEAVRAAIVRSANDAAVALAERLAGDEASFARRMTAVALELGMTASRFQNATGMTMDGHVTTARDMALLVLALRRDFPDHWALFNARAMRWKREVLSTLNVFLTTFSGAEGVKTGFTCHAGYNLAAAARHGGRIVVGVVLGVPERGTREIMMARWFKDVLATPQAPGFPLNAIVNGAGRLPDLSERVCGGGGGPVARDVPTGWGLEVAFAPSAAEARRIVGATLRKLERQLGPAGIRVTTKPMGGRVFYRGIITGLKEESAVSTCLAMRARSEDCLVLTPSMMAGALDEERIYHRLAAY